MLQPVKQAGSSKICLDIVCGFLMW